MLLSCRSSPEGYLLEKMFSWDCWTYPLTFLLLVEVLQTPSCTSGCEKHLVCRCFLPPRWHLFPHLSLGVVLVIQPVIPGTAAFLQLSDTFQLSYSNVLSQEFVRSVENYSSEKYFSVFYSFLKASTEVRIL